VIVLDAGVLIAQLSPLDTHHEAATQALLGVVDEDLVVHRITLAEVLVGGVRLGRGPQMWADVRAAGVRLLPPAEGEPLRLAELRVRTGLRLPDCCVLETALSSQSSLMTFDRALATAADGLGVPIRS
jgi:predicted nucleic acid-binding protein